MAASLDGIDARLDWVDGTLAQLHSEAVSWTAENEAGGTMEFYKQARVVALRLVMPTPPIEWGVVVGNIVHQLRSVLDNLVWQLVILNGSEPHGGGAGNMFPIVPPDRGDEAFRRDRLRGMHPDHEAFIESIQPYNRPGGVDPELNFLWHLDELANLDKHRLLVPIAHAIVPGDEGGFRWGVSRADAIGAMHNHMGRLSDGAIIAWCEVSEDYSGDVDVQPEFAYQLVLERLPRMDFVNTLSLLNGSVRGVVNDLRRAFGQTEKKWSPGVA